MPQQQKFKKKQVGFGKSLVLEVHFHSNGLKPLTDAIRRAVGDHIGTRNTFAKLYEMDEPPDEDNPKDRYRAWLLLTALGEDPREWGISDDAVPPTTDQDALKDMLTVWIGWFSPTTDEAPSLTRRG